MKSTMQDWSDPLARLRQAANQVVAESMAAVHSIISNTPEASSGLTAIRLRNNDEGGMYWYFRTVEGGGQWYNADDLASGDLSDQLFEAQGGIDLHRASEIDPYVLTRHPHGYTEDMVVNAYTGEVAWANLDPVAMRDTHRLLTEQPHPLGAIMLVYLDARGDRHLQPLANLTDVGTLIDPDTGDDLELVGWQFPDQTTS